MFKSLKELEKTVQKLDKTLGLTKVRLVHASGDGEGIWAVPTDADSKAKLESDLSHNEFAFVRLMNQPLGWNDLSWGGLVRVKTNGRLRADGILDDQDLPEIIADRANIQELIAEENKPKKVKKTKAKAKKK